MRGKLAFIAESLKEFDLDFLCLTETWLLQSDIDIIKAALPMTYSLLHVPRLSGRGGGIALIYSLAISNIKLVTGDLEMSSFELMEVCFGCHQQTFRLALIYRPGHSGTDHAFMEEFGLFLDVFFSKTWKAHGLWRLQLLGGQSNIQALLSRICGVAGPQQLI